MNKANFVGLAGLLDGLVFNFRHRLGNRPTCVVNGSRNREASEV
jgi:hypothetical protein